MNPRKRRKLNNDKIRILKKKLINSNKLISFIYEEELNDIFNEYKELFTEKIDFENIKSVKENIKNKKNKLKRIIKLSKYLIYNKYEYIKDSLVILEKLDK